MEAGTIVVLTEIILSIKDKTNNFRHHCIEVVSVFFQWGEKRMKNKPEKCWWLIEKSKCQ